jgi:hypothetical protein
MTKNGFGLLIPAMLVLGMGVISCVTYVPIKSVRLPTIDTTGIQRLAVKPFENVSGIRSPDTAQLTRYLTDRATTLITGTGKFTMVGPADTNADGVFTGELINITSKDTQEKKEGKDKDGKATVQIIYKRDVTVEFSYSIISTRTDMPIGKVLRKDSAYSSDLDQGNLSDILTLAKGIVDSQIRGLPNDMVAHIVSESRRLMKETSKDKVVKEKMKMALAFVNNGNYEEAIRQYDIIYSENGSAAARVNAEILRQSLASDIAATARLTEIFNDKGGLTEKAINKAVDALHSKLPSGTNISIMKTRSTGGDMIDYVVDQLTKTIIQRGKITVIDRLDQALIDAEQQFQLSGMVSDESAVSIGKQLGVKYIVLYWIGGEKSLRRLNTKLLNIETAQIEYQDDVEI